METQAQTLDPLDPRDEEYVKFDDQRNFSYGKNILKLKQALKLKLMNEVRARSEGQTGAIQQVHYT